MKKAFTAACAACLAIGALFGSAAATGSIAHPRVVSDDPANFTPNVIDGGGVSHTSVDAVAQLGDNLYAGGNFRLVERNGTTFTRTNLVSFSATTGAVSNSFAPTFDGKVFALLATGGSLYVGGYFSNVNG